MSWQSRNYWLRAFALWFLLMMAETLHGVWRVKVLALRIGDAAARNVSVFTGSLVKFLMFSPLLAARLRRRLSEPAGEPWVPGVRDVTPGRDTDHGSSGRDLRKWQLNSWRSS
jgi:hypothetical protein